MVHEDLFNDVMSSVHVMPTSVAAASIYRVSYRNILEVEIKLEYIK